MTSRNRKKRPRSSMPFAPENRRKTGAKRSPENRRLTGDFGYKKINPSVGKATQFQPGQSGNPGGRPTKTPLTDELLELLKAVDRRGITLARRIAMVIVKKAEKGDARFVDLLFERVEGPAVQVHTVAGDENAPSINLNVADAHERLAQIIARIKARQAQTQQQGNTGGKQ